MRDPSPATSGTLAPSTADFRKLMGQFATGVCVVSVEPPREREERAVAAMTINSFVSVSLEPMLVCWSLHNSSSQFDLFAKAERFAVSILASDQAELALRYAARADTQLRSEDFGQSAAGLPVINRAIGHFECHHFAAHEAGDHTMILGEVTGMRALSQDKAKPAPLGFLNGKFCSIGQ
ncbi:MAG: flavin reductase family protein [Erythrobacter sp.]